MNRTKIRQLAGFFTVAETAKQLGVQVGNLRYWIKSDLVDNPTRTIGKNPRLYYSEFDIKRLRKQLDLQGSGDFSLATAAEKLGITRVTLTKLIHDGRLPPPHRGKKIKTYSESDFEELKNIFLNLKGNWKKKKNNNKECK